MPPLDGCGRSEIALILQSKPNLDGTRDIAREVFGYVQAFL